jgi:hypothetical protein
LLFEAFFSESAVKKRSLVSKSLAMAKLRRKKYFVGDRAYLAEVEPIFLAMEGPAEWVRFRLMMDAKTLPDRPELRAADARFTGYAAFRAMTQKEALDFISGADPYWSQHHGLALCLLLDQLRPGWQRELLADPMPSPYELLEASLAPSTAPRQPPR